MTNLVVSVDRDKVIEILQKFGTTFEYPVNIEEFAKEISACCVKVNFTSSESLAVSISNSN
jgi:hypothetical protein